MERKEVANTAVKKPANPTSYNFCLSNASTDSSANLQLSGTSTKLNDILNTKSSNSHISIKQ